MSDLETFRTQTRAWLEANCPPEMRKPPVGEDDTCWGGRHVTFKSDAQKQWMERMAAKGWTVPDWPTRIRRRRTLARRGERSCARKWPRSDAARRWTASASGCSGPLLLEYGNEAQKNEHLPKIARGEIRWCQGYSEPGAGSDLAALQTRAIDRAITSSSTARRSGPRTPTRPTGFSASCAPIQRPQTRRHQLRAVRHGKRRRFD